MLAASVSSWLRTRRSRYLIICICSPIIIPFLCATFPLLCAVELCLRILFRRRKISVGSPEEKKGLGRCEEGCCGNSRDELGLLQRYLEDQLRLVGSVYGCGDEEDF